MSTQVILGFLLGAVLGMRFKVFILLPAVAFAVCIVAVAGIVNSSPASTVFIAAVLTSVCLQFGYVGGVVTRHITVLARTARLRKVSRKVATVR
jgi:hypothetical protein